MLAWGIVNTILAILAFMLVLALIIGASLWIAKMLLFAFLVFVVISVFTAWRKRTA